MTDTRTEHTAQGESDLEWKEEIEQHCSDYIDGLDGLPAVLEILSEASKVAAEDTTLTKESALWRIQYIYDLSRYYIEGEEQEYEERYEAYNGFIPDLENCDYQ